MIYLATVNSAGRIGMGSQIVVHVATGVRPLLHLAMTLGPQPWRS